jgi:hypothetical protein
MVSTLVDCSAQFLDRAIVASIVISLVLNLIFVAVYTTRYYGLRHATRFSQAVEAECEGVQTYVLHDFGSNTRNHTIIDDIVGNIHDISRRSHDLTTSS